MNEALILLMLATITINVVAIWFLSSAANRYRSQQERIGELEAAVESQRKQLHGLKEYTESIHFHHEALSRSLRLHLHAAGLVYEPRFWRSYDAVVREKWPFEQKNWPYHLPRLGKTGKRMEDSADAQRVHDNWLTETRSGDYSQDPQQLIDTGYIDALNDRCNPKTED